METSDLTVLVQQGRATLVPVVEHMRETAATPTTAIPLPVPLKPGSRFLIWKQDPTVLTPGRRLVFIEGAILNGPRDARIDTVLAGTTPVPRDLNGDFILQAPDVPGADAANAWAVVRLTLTMWERMYRRLAIPGKTSIPWAWNTNGNTDVIAVHPRAGVTPNAYYSRAEKALKFFYFTPGGTTTPVFTCRSLDIAAHEAGHAVLDGLKPGWLGGGNVAQTGALHESFGDLSALFLVLSQLDQAEALIAITKGNLHAKNFLAALAEEFGGALGNPIGLRNADNDLKLSQVSNQVHALSQVFTGGIYDVLADMFALQRNLQSTKKDPAQILVEVSQDLATLLLRGIVNAPATQATFTHVIDQMLVASAARNDPPAYRTYLRNRFALREVIVSPTPLTTLMQRPMRYDSAAFDGDGTKADGAKGNGPKIEAAQPHHPSATKGVAQDRSDSCGTMQLPEWQQSKKALVRQMKDLSQPGAFTSPEDILGEEIKALAGEFA